MLVKVQFFDDHQLCFFSFFSTFLTFAFFSWDSSIGSKIRGSPLSANYTDLFVVQPGTHFGGRVAPVGNFFTSFTIFSTCSSIIATFGRWGRGISSHTGTASTGELASPLSSKVAGTS